MARSIQEIFDSIQAARAADPVLAALNSPSATAVHRLWAYLTAVVLWAHETIFDRHKADVEATVARAKPGTAAWYAAQALRFQEGDTLLVDDQGIHYAATDTGAKIITRAVAKENAETGKLFIKVATDGAQPGTLASLSAGQLVQVKGYFNAIRFAGTRLEVVSREADRLRLAGDVYYDPLVGEAVARAQVQAALVAYQGRLEFDGLIFKTRIEDAIQSAPAVKDVLLREVSARTGQALPVVIERVYETQAGYIVEEDTDGLHYLDTLNFLPYGTI